MRTIHSEIFPAATAACFKTALRATEALQRLSRGTRFALAASTLLLYALAFNFMHAHVGNVAAVLNVVPAFAFGGLLGIRGGLAYGALAGPLNVLLFQGVDQADLGMPTHLLGAGAFTLISLAVGWVHELHRKLARQTDTLRAESRRLRDEVERRTQAEARLTHEVLHDPLTQLPNRRLFLDRLQHAFDWSRRQPGGLCAVLFLDLDSFKDVNDSLGHGIGDRLLIDVARRLQASVRAVDTVARVGGDEFAIVLESVTGRDGVRAVVERLRANLAALPASGADTLPMARASIGAVIGLARYQHLDEILRDADSAMYLAKAGGGDGFVIFSPDAHASRATAGVEAEAS